MSSPPSTPPRKHSLRQSSQSPPSRHTLPDPTATDDSAPLLDSRRSSPPKHALATGPKDPSPSYRDREDVEAAMAQYGSPTSGQSGSPSPRSPKDAPTGWESNAFKLFLKNNFGDAFALIAQGGMILWLIVVWQIVIPRPAGLFTYHPPFQTVAVLLFTQGILSLQPTKTAAAKRTGLLLHAIFQFLGLICIIDGTAVIMYNKDLRNAPHFYSWHGRLGVATFGLVCVQFIFGVAIGNEYTRKLVGGDRIGKSLWKYHRALGYIIFALFLATGITATKADWVVQNASSARLTVWVVALVLGVVGVYGRISFRKIVPATSSRR